MKKIFLIITVIGCSILSLFCMVNFLTGDDQIGFQHSLICLLGAAMFYLFIIIDEKDAEISKLKDYSSTILKGDKKLQDKYDEILKKDYSIF